MTDGSATPEAANGFRQPPQPQPDFATPEDLNGFRNPRHPERIFNHLFPERIFGALRNRVLDKSGASGIHWCQRLRTTRGPEHVLGHNPRRRPQPLVARTLDWCYSAGRRATGRCGQGESGRDQWGAQKASPMTRKGTASAPDALAEERGPRGRGTTKQLSRHAARPIRPRGAAPTHDDAGRRQPLQAGPLKGFCGLARGEGDRRTQ